MSPRRLPKGQILQLAALVLLGALTGSRASAARAGRRPVFEPTDLELQTPGQLNVDLQLGAIRSQGPTRLVLPDFELSFGLLRNVELDLSGAYAVEGPTRGPFTFDHSTPDALWPSVKLGIFDFRTESLADRLALGAQFGPKVAVARLGRGLGVEALLLLGYTHDGAQVVLNLGGVLDPAPGPGAARPRGLELGLDLQAQLGSSGCSLLAEVSGLRYFTADPPQLTASAGLAFEPRDDLALSLIGLVGFLAGSDRYGLLLGVSPTFELWK